MQLARPSPIARSTSQLNLRFIEQLKCMLHGMLFIQCYSNMEEQSKHQNCWAGHGRLTRERRPPGRGRTAGAPVAGGGGGERRRRNGGVLG